jgi:hypothetical protein
LLYCADCGKVLPLDDYPKLYQIKESRLFEDIQDDLNFESMIGDSPEILLDVDLSCRECFAQITNGQKVEEIEIAKKDF